MASTVTVTGVTGPGVAVTAAVINNVNSFEINCDVALLRVASAGRTQVNDIDITGKTSLTLTQSGGNYTLTVA